MHRISEQADLFETRAQHRDRATRELQRAMADAADALTLKEVAFELDLSPATVANALAGRDRKAPPLGWLLSLVEMDPEHRLLRWLAGRVGCEVRVVAKLTPEQELAAIKRALAAAGPMGRAVMQQLGISAEVGP